MGSLSIKQSVPSIIPGSDSQGYHHEGHEVTRRKSLRTGFLRVTLFFVVIGFLEDAELLVLLLAQLLGVGFFGGGSVYRLRFVRTGTGIIVAGLDVDVGVLA